MTNAVVEVQIVEEAFAANTFLDDFGDAEDVGAVASFVGKCRSEGGRLKALELEHYGAMATAQLTQIGETAAERWPISAIRIVHRHGRILPGENIVLVAAASTHRAACQSAVQFVMDYLKTDAPFWKKEHPKDGAEGAWVEAKATDDEAKDRWR